MRICFERIIPFDRRALAMSHYARIALQVSKKWSMWGTAAVVKCRFLEGSAKMKKQVEAVAHQWERHADIEFKFVRKGPAEVRIAFAPDSGSWSAVGTDALNEKYFPKDQATMNFGWLDDATDVKEYQRVVLHEFGHALGCVHEHQSPKFTRKWNVPAVMQAFSGPPNRWSRAEIKSNVLEHYSPRGMDATQFDPQSIMLYAFDGRLFSDGLGSTNENSKLSRTDIRHIKAMYPFKARRART